ncbi:tetratricopeptide repeat protein [Rhodospirillum rubrum]|uniref:protein O-GlcNAc transferase n=1 Tax=Rhodospirillum rubrum (strain ATCC 11170 / ATH 1.1.1 / DSM 467 / LMG 4362 / NCIMB 8255 / S1) TaxID=269796 RepID=Q2RQ78_RHORT|nr:tetratricopeptide repeat protein [Rhodospirillum rubrum]ABC23717.1 conserved hypothetical protein [Rhodospirillum rubrum ATCC 11170]MBK5955393.1 hypothetical protein [Rhodospirillum rubrum]QXG79673.1 tetratricopeptide repeat protein [Rhodospirillum rubrum]HAP98925.1 hypothetical protein [Rhodospirillum rubrum]HCF17655.1 hypothetical protein [Rhodospirillum rubrum]
MMTHSVESAMSVPVRLDEALRLHGLGRPAEALALYDAVLAEEPRHAEALHLSALAALAAGKGALARARVDGALALTPDDADLWRSLALILRAAGEAEAMGRALETALALRPAFPAAALALAESRLAAGDGPGAASLLRQQPDSPEILAALAPLLVGLGDAEGALEAADRRLALEEDDPSAGGLIDRGTALLALGRTEEAIATLRTALALAEGQEAWTARINLADALARQGNWRGAARTYGANAGDFPAVALALASTMPLVPASTADIAEARQRLVTGLETLRERRAFVPDPNALFAGIAHPLLAAHGIDDRLLMADIADTVRGLCPVLGHTARHIGKAPHRGRRRIGVLAPAGAPAGEGIAAALLEGLAARADVEAIALTLDGAEAKAPPAGRGAALPTDLFKAQEALDALELDGLVHAEVGAGARATALAHGRFAPLQVALGGHPATSGLASIDWFVSSAGMEPAGARAHYREALFRLPHPIMPALPPVAEAADRDRLALPGDETLYLCAQPLHRLPPAFDRLAAAILEGDRRGRLCLFRPDEPALAGLLEARMALAGVAAERILWLRRTRRGIYLAALKAVDVVLDAPHWGGDGTARDALALGTPVVAWQGALMRDRRAAFWCAAFGLDEAVVRTAEAYVRQALAFGRDRAKRRAAAERLCAAAPRLFGDPRGLSALVSFLADGPPSAEARPKA